MYIETGQYTHLSELIKKHQHKIKPTTTKTTITEYEESRRNICEAKIQWTIRKYTGERNMWRGNAPVLSWFIGCAFEYCQLSPVFRAPLHIRKRSYDYEPATLLQSVSYVNFWFSSSLDWLEFLVSSSCGCTVWDWFVCFFFLEFREQIFSVFNWNVLFTKQSSSQNS